MSVENWKLERDLCRCCHSEGCFKNLAEHTVTPDIDEAFADILKECYDVEMVPVPGMISAVTYTICDVCIIRLRDASDFKKQVVQCEERFKDMYSRNAISIKDPIVATVEVVVKQETPDSEAEDDMQRDPPVGEDNNDGGDHEESADFQRNEAAEEPVPEVRKKRKYKPRKTAKTVKNVKSKPTKRTKRTKMIEETDEENDADKKQGRDEVSQFRLNDEDYKKDGGVYHCARCDKTYNKKDSLRHHVKSIHYKIPKYTCSICMEAFMTLPPLTVHKLEVHNIDDRVTCSVCNKMFNAKVQLSRHINNFHMLGEIGARYKCEYCDYETFQSEAMYKHKIKHKTVKDHHCRYCEKSFMRKKTLKLHERIHTGDRRKVCNVCGQAFVQKASLNYHMMKYHPDVSY